MNYEYEGDMKTEANEVSLPVIKYRIRRTPRQKDIIRKTGDDFKKQNLKMKHRN